MSNTRQPSKCERITTSITPRSGETSKFLIPVTACVAIGGLFAFPSVAYASFTYSLLPIYTLRALGVGATLGVSNILLGRLFNKKTPEDESFEKTKNKDEYVALVKINGEIDAKFSDTYLPILINAFKDSKAKGVVIKMNSPGGLPVQSSIVCNEILKLKEKYHKKVVVVGEDMLTSGAYYIAVSADAIYVNASTATGSIGVISHSYGFADFAKKHGIESRTYTAGTNKSRLNPLLPEDEKDVAKMKEVLNEIHADFINAVTIRRGDKLKDKEKLFSGDFWTGKSALELGLVDGIGNLSDAMQKEFDVSRYKEYKKDISFAFLDNLSKIANNQNIEVKLSLDSRKPNMKI